MRTDRERSQHGLGHKDLLGLLSLLSRMRSLKTSYKDPFRPTPHP